MEPRASQGVYLERRTYRRRRLADGLKMLPVLGAVLWLIPLSWRRAGQMAEGGGQTGVSVVDASIFIFTVWGALVLIGAVLAFAQAHTQDAPRPDGGPAGPAPRARATAEPQTMPPEQAETRARSAPAAAPDNPRTKEPTWSR